MSKLLSSGGNVRVYLIRDSVGVIERCFGRSIYESTNKSMGTHYVDIDVKDFIKNSLLCNDADSALLTIIQADPTVSGASMLVRLASFTGNCFSDDSITCIFHTRSSDGTYAYEASSRKLEDLLKFFLHLINFKVDPMPEAFGSYNSFKNPVTSPKKSNSPGFFTEIIKTFRQIKDDAWQWILQQNKKQELWKNSICATAQTGASIVLEELNETFLNRRVNITHTNSIFVDSLGEVERIDTVHSGRGEHYFEFKLDTGYFFAIIPSIIGDDYTQGIIPRANGHRRISLLP